MSIFVNEQALDNYENKVFMQAINEAYFGRTPGITKCFNAFCDFRHKYLSTSKINNSFRAITNLTADHDKDLHRFCNEMERQFGFDSFSFIIENSLDINACTYGILLGDNSHQDPKKNIIIDKEGYHFKKELKMSCIVSIYTALLFDNELSDDETFAIILHEIGHNFQQYMNGNMQSLGLIYKAVYIYETILYFLIDLGQGNIDSAISNIFWTSVATKPTHNLISKAYNKITSNENMLNLYSYFNFIKGLVNIPSSIISSITMVPLAPILGIISGVIDVLQSILFFPFHAYNYMGEQIADAFPTYYGFGEVNVNIFKKHKLGSPFGPFVEGVGKIPLVGHLYNVLLIPAQLLIEIGDCHPSDITRCQAMLDSMKTDLNDKRLSPKLRKELSEQIENIEKSLDNYYDKAITIKNPNLFKDFIDKCIFQKGGDIKYRTYKTIFKLPESNMNMANHIRENSNIANTKII